MHVTDVGIVGGQLERAVECELYSGPEAFRDTSEDGAAPSAGICTRMRERDAAQLISGET